MQIKGIKVHFVVLALVAVLAVLLTINFIYHKYNVEEPLFKLDNEVKAVQKMEIDEKSQPIVLKVVLNKTDSLRRTYLDVFANSKEILGGKEFKIVLKDRRDKELEGVYYRSQFVIYEAIAKGNFTVMAQTVEKEAAKIGAQATLFIDEDNIYVQITKGDRYLYEVIPREKKPVEVSQAGGGIQ